MIIKLRGGNVAQPGSSPPGCFLFGDLPVEPLRIDLSEIAQDLLTCLALNQLRGRQYRCTGTTGHEDGSVGASMTIIDVDGNTHQVEVRLHHAQAT